MPRPPSITPEQLLKAARTVLLEKGVHATTADVARRAGVAEGSLFRHFKTKEALFLASLRGEMEDPEWLRTLLERSGHGDLRQHLYDTALLAIEFFRRAIPISMMLWSRDPKLGVPPHLQGREAPPLRAMRKLAGFFEAEMRAGRLRRHDPEILARIFGGALHSYAFFEILIQANDQLPMPVEMYVRGLVHLIWTGAAPPTRKGKKE